MDALLPAVLVKVVGQELFESVRPLPHHHPLLLPQNHLLSLDQVSLVVQVPPQQLLDQHLKIVLKPEI